MSERERPAGLLRQAAIALVLSGAAGVFLYQVHQHYPVQHWLFWRYALAWLAALGFALGCTSAGWFTLDRLLPRGSLRLGESFVLSFAVGLVEFFVCMVGLGLLGLYGKIFFFALPLGFIALGARALYRRLRRAFHLIRARRTKARPVALYEWLLGAAGLTALLVVYFPLLSPENAAFDSRWQHLGIAEHYAAAGGFVRFPEGWFIGTSPHLAAVVYTWAFLAPWGTLFDRVELAAHVELVCFLTTLPAITALVRRLVPRTRARFAWVARFAFPGVFLYDSSLAVAADHMAAVFAVPVFLALLRVWRSFDWRWSALFGVFVSGALMTKYSGALLLVGYPLLALGVLAITLAVLAAVRRERPRRFGWLTGVGALALAGLVLTAPHWLKNWVWYGNPVYPMLHGLFPSSQPWTADAAERFDLGFLSKELWRPERNLEGLVASLKALVTFSFVPNDWPQFHGKVPVFGSLFTLSIVCLPFIKPTRRLLSLYLAAHVGIFLWYWTHHQDRYLQAAMPWLAAAVASVWVLVWRTGVLARVSAGALLALQVIWGGDVPFIPSHAITGNAFKATLDLLATGYKRSYTDRLKPLGLYAVGTKLPKGAYVLVHESRPRAGLRARAATDLPGNQGGLSYGELGTPRAVHEKLRSFGVTHVLWESARTKHTDNLAGDLVFWELVSRVLVDKAVIGGTTLGRLPAEPPPEQPERRVLLTTCSAAGLYRLSDLRDPGYRGLPRYPGPLEPLPAPTESLAPLLAKADFVVIEARCARRDPAIATAFAPVASGPKHEIWLRAQPGAIPAP